MADTVTKLMLTHEEARSLVEELQIAIRKASEVGEIKHVYGTYEQSVAQGPWRLVLTVCPPSEEERQRHQQRMPKETRCAGCGGLVSGLVSESHICVPGA